MKIYIDGKHRQPTIGINLELGGILYECVGITDTEIVVSEVRDGVTQPERLQFPADTRFEKPKKPSDVDEFLENRRKNRDAPEALKRPHYDYKVPNIQLEIPLAQDKEQSADSDLEFISAFGKLITEAPALIAKLATLDKAALMLVEGMLGGISKPSEELKIIKTVTTDGKTFILGEVVAK